MVYLVTALLLTVGSFALCFYFNISPGTALYKAARRLLKRPEALRPIKRDAPYRRIGVAQNALHRPVLLNLETSEGSGQASHPDVLYIPEGFGLKGWTYWMVCTPYPYAESCFENPEIFVSYDGVLWTVPDGVQNPLVPTPKTAGDHHSDPDMVFHENKLWLFYRETRRSKAQNKGPNENRIYMMKSADGVHWSAPLKILNDTAGTQMLSPAVIHDRSCFVMWTVEIQGGELKLMRRISSDAVNWNSPEPCNIIGLDKGRHPWHIDVIREKDRLSAALVSYVGLNNSGGSGSRIHYAYSEDDGLTWFAGGFLLDQVYEFESQLQYRASLRMADEQRQEYELWYSAASLADMFSIAYLRLFRVGSRLLPCEPQQHQDSSLTEVR